MIPDDPYLIVRSASIYLTATLTMAVWAVRRPAGHVVAAGMLAFFWNLPVLLALNVAASRLGWWHFDARGGLMLGVPVDLWLAWAWLWSVLPILVSPALPLGVVITGALALDLVLMPLAHPVVRLESTWLVGEGVGLFCALLPGQLLARWTAQGKCLTGRAFLQVITFAGVVLFLLPTAILEGTDTTWRNPAHQPIWQLSLYLQLLAIPAIAGLSAVQEFAQRGGGTPVPFDPPQRLVTTGIYAYVRNPMQLAAVVGLLLLGLVIQNVWISAAGVMAHIYSFGLAGWDEDADLRRRFGADWTAYRRHVPRWLPRFRPWQRRDFGPDRLYVAESCGMCSETGRWFEKHGATGLQIVPAETHPALSLTRITYEPGDGSPPAMGIDAIGRALEHINVVWALVGITLRLPVVRPILQLLVDASGGEERNIWKLETKI